MGSNYVEAMCDKFIEEDRYLKIISGAPVMIYLHSTWSHFLSSNRWLKNFAYELPVVGSNTIEMNNI